MRFIHFCAVSFTSESQRRITWSKPRDHMTAAALLFTWLFNTEVDVESRCSSFSTMAVASAFLFIISFYSCYAQVPLLMWTSDGYVILSFRGRFNVILRGLRLYTPETRQTLLSCVLRDLTYIDIKIAWLLYMCVFKLFYCMTCFVITGTACRI